MLSSRVLSATIANTDEPRGIVDSASERISRRSAGRRSKSGWPFPVVKEAGADMVLIFEPPGLNEIVLVFAQR